MHSLEPIMYSKDKIIYEELEIFNEVTFFMKGKFKVGFTLDYEQEFFPYFKTHTVIGAFGATF